MKRLLAFIALVCAITSAGNVFAAALIAKEKKINRNYPVSSSDKLYIDNCYGKVSINTWNKNEITVDITITVKARSEEKAQDLFDDISIKEQEKSGNIMFKTVLRRKTITLNENTEMSIDYVVNMPSKNALELINKFGAVDMDNFEGNLNLAVEYGALKTGDLTGADKNIRVAFGSADINSVNTGKIDISYSALNIRSAQTLEVKNMFGKTDIGTIQSLRINQHYSDLHVGNVGILSGTLEFANLNVEKVTKSSDMTLKYCSKADFGSIGIGVTNFHVNSSFGNVYCNFENGADFLVDIRTSFGSFKDRSSSGSIKEQDQADRYGQDRHYTGKIGRGTGRLHITATYGDVVFK